MPHRHDVMTTAEATPTPVLTDAGPGTAPPHQATVRLPVGADRGAAATTLVVLAADVAALALAAGAAAAVATAIGLAPRLGAVQVLAFGGWMLVASAMFRLYPGAALSRVEELRRQVLLAASAGMVFALSAAGIGDPRTALPPAAMAAAAMVALPTLRSLARYVASRTSWWGVPVVVLGAGPFAARLIANLNENPDHGLRPVANVGVDAAYGPADEGASARVDAQLRGWLDAGVHHAVVAVGDVSWEALPSVLRVYGRHFASVMVVREAAGMPTVGLHAVSVAGHLGLGMQHKLAVGVQRALKRAVDLALLAPFALVAFPLVVVLAAWVWTSSRGSPFYFQEREGRDGRPFKVWKLRTMYQDAEELLERYLNENPAARTEWESRYKLSPDPRILPGVGVLLRRTSLDELPQLWNILLGEMSFVGPRPFPYYHLAAFDDDFRTLRRSVTPGLSGLWQVSVRSDGDTALQRELDSSYIANWSIWLDIYVLARTPWAVLRGKGAR